MRKVLFVLLALFTPASLHAQAVEIYGTVTAINANNVPSLTFLQCPGTNCPLEVDSSTNTHQAGVGGGVTFNVLRLPVLKLGLDLRGSRHSGTNGADTALGGLKLTVHPPFLHLRPYLQGSIGYLGTATTPPDSAVAPHTAHYLAAEGLAGVDLPLIRILDLRLLEIGAGHALNSVYSTKPTFVTASAGLVLHF